MECGIVGRTFAAAGTNMLVTVYTEFSPGGVRELDNFWEKRPGYPSGYCYVQGARVGQLT